MNIVKWTAAFSFCLVVNVVFCQSLSSAKVVGIIKGINVYFPGSVVQNGDGNKLNLNVQGTIVAIPLCHVELAKPDEHNISFISNAKNENILRGTEPTSTVKLLIVHGTNAEIFSLLHSLQVELCGK